MMLVRNQKFSVNEVPSHAGTIVLFVMDACSSNAEATYPESLTQMSVFLFSRDSSWLKVLLLVKAVRELSVRIERGLEHNTQHNRNKARSSAASYIHDHGWWGLGKLMSSRWKAVLSEKRQSGKAKVGSGRCWCCRMRRGGRAGSLAVTQTRVGCSEIYFHSTLVFVLEAIDTWRWNTKGVPQGRQREEGRGSRSRAGRRDAREKGTLHMPFRCWAAAYRRAGWRRWGARSLIFRMLDQLLEVMAMCTDTSAGAGEFRAWQSSSSVRTTQASSPPPHYTASSRWNRAGKPAREPDWWELAVDGLNEH